MDLVKLIKPKNILQKVKKTRPVKAQIKTPTENDDNKAILSKGRNCEGVVNPAPTHVFRDNYIFFLLSFTAWVSVWWGGSTASLNEMVSIGKGKAHVSHNKVCFEQQKNEH